MATDKELEQAAAELKANMDNAKIAMEVFPDRARFATTPGVLKPIFQVAGIILKLALGKRESEELTYMKEQFQIVRNQLDVISDQIKQVLWEIEKSTINNQYFPIEENLKNQFRKYMDILNAAPEFRENEKKEFLTHFDVTKGDQNLHTLFDAVMGYSAIFGKPILETAMKYDQRNRRLMEGLCSRLKELFCIGLIALVGHSTITGTDVEALKREWNEKMAKVENKMKSMIDQCINEFADQAEIDVEALIKNKGERDNKGCATFIIEALAEKYDWVKWSVRVYDPVAGFDNHCVIGPNRFHFFRLNGVNAVVSYAIDPMISLNEVEIRHLMEGKDGWTDAREVAKHVYSNLPSGHVVHTVRRYKDLWLHKNFPNNCHFWETYSGVTLCVHST
ncbi:protein rapunzel-like [Stegostoma tigrinum]|uniref:protein rapunzel-like n=1 Tax=Stegostoma tigrinum TaxID=3053191 RepID=UPI00202AF779|nr:protein rapunzel-like [Stegostoma tigrinum]XP_048403996.1 protein rapunzel-like [Stegostoma tigrinum]